MVPKSFRNIEPGVFYDANLDLTIQVASPSVWVFGRPDGLGSSLELLALDDKGDAKAALARAAHAATASRKRRRLVPA